MSAALCEVSEGMFVASGGTAVLLIVSIKCMTVLVSLRVSIAKTKKSSSRGGLFVSSGAVQ